ncbi:hypothetical protein MMPV_006234 [Pyropia vietnamensis]
MAASARATDNGVDARPPIKNQGCPAVLPADPGTRVSQDARVTSEVGTGFVLFTLENYKDSATLGVTPQSTKAYFPVLDTGAGPNLLRKDTLPDSWLAHVRVIRGPTIKDANGRIIRATQAVTLTADIGNLTTEVDFLVCETLLVPCILGCSFINKYVEAIQPSKRVRDLHDADGSARGCTAIVRDLTATPTHVNVAEVYADAVPAVVRLAKRTRFEAMTETVTPVHCDLAGLCQVRSVQRTHYRQEVTLANGLIDLQVGGPAYVVVANYRQQAVILPKGTRLGIAAPLEGSIATLPEDRVEPLEVLQITEEEESPAAVTTEANPACNQAGTDELTEADLRHLPARVAEKVRHMLSKHSVMWTGGALGTIGAT